MTSEDLSKRAAVVLAMLDALGRRVTDSAVTMIVQSTASIPYPWLRDACLDLAKRWDESQRNPGAPAIHRTAYNLAGFRPRYATYDYFDPTPDTVRWWPPEGARVPKQLAERWEEDPRFIPMRTDGLALLLPGGGEVLRLAAG